MRIHEAVSSKISAQDHMTNVLRLTDEQKKSNLDRWPVDMARPKIKEGDNPESS